MAKKQRVLFAVYLIFSLAVLSVGVLDLFAMESLLCKDVFPTACPNGGCSIGPDWLGSDCYITGCTVPPGWARCTL